MDEDEGGLEDAGRIGGEGIRWVDDASGLEMESVSERADRGGVIMGGAEKGAKHRGGGRGGVKRIERGEGKEGQGEGGGGRRDEKWSKAVFHRILKERAAEGSKGKPVLRGEEEEGGGNPGSDRAAGKGTPSSASRGTPPVKGTSGESEADSLMMSKLMDLVKASLHFLSTSSLLDVACT